MNKQLQTPCFIVHKDLVDKQLNLLKEGLDRYWKNSLIGYSYKTNSLPWLIDYYNKQGCYAEVVSDDEYYLGKRIGVDAHQFIYNGPAKTRESFLEALINGSIVNIDSKRELEWLDDLEVGNPYRIGLRVNFDIEKACPGHSACGEDGGRFGFCYENGELKKALDTISSKGFSVSCLHLHTSSKTRSIEVYKAIAKKACEIKQKYDLTLSCLDIGGGFYGGLENKPQFMDYLREVCEILSGDFNSECTTLIVEPGMSLIGPSVSYVTTVTDVKDTTYGRYVVTDGSRTNIDPLMSKANYFYDIEHISENKNNIPKQIICGYTCMENDRLFCLQNDKELVLGDKIIYHKVGAYTMCLMPCFIKYFPRVYLQTNNEYRLIRERWTPEEYCAQSLWGKE